MGRVAMLFSKGFKTSLLAIRKKKMKQQLLQHTDLKTSRLIAGCMGLGGGWEPDVLIDASHEKQARDFIETALELGINFFDHANIYARGRAEEVFGRILKERPSLRDQIILQSKVGIRMADDPTGSPQRFDFSFEHIIEATDAILRRLQTDRLDILLLHRPDILIEGEEVAHAFARLKQEGKVRYFGVSNQNRFMMEYVQRFLPDPLIANQLEMNLLHNGFAESVISFNQGMPTYPDGWEGVVEYCRLSGVHLQAWSPLARGVLTGGNLSGQSPAVVKTAALVKSMARDHGVSGEAIVLAWLLRHPASIQPVLGTSRSDRLRPCAESVTVKLTREEWYRLFESARGNQMP
jgi:predicted oxidoreductase